MRLISRDDASLGVALIAASVILFRQPLRDALDLVQAAEAKYRLDLLPALLLLTVVFAFHQYRKRTEARAAESAASLDAARARLQSRTLQQFVELSQGLGQVQDRQSLQQILWKHLPSLVGDREFWVVLYRSGWEVLIHDRTRDPRADEVLARIAERAVRPTSGSEPPGAGTDGDEECFPMLVSGSLMGVLAIRGGLPSGQHEIMSAAAATIAIAVKNMHLLLDTREQSVRDELTGCVNRAYGLEVLSLELRRARRTNVPVSVLMFDIDNFKMVNDQFGHLAGDEVLRSVGAQLRRVLRSTDVRVRYGGDEFVIILPDTPAVGAHHVAEGLRQELARAQVMSANLRVATTVSIGVTAAVPGEVDASAVVARVDAALYDAKRRGRNRVAVAPTPVGLTTSEPDGLLKAV